LHPRFSTRPPGECPSAAGVAAAVIGAVAGGPPVGPAKKMPLRARRRPEESSREGPGYGPARRILGGVAPRLSLSASPTSSGPGALGEQSGVPAGWFCPALPRAGCRAPGASSPSWRRPREAEAARLFATPRIPGPGENSPDKTAARLARRFFGRGRRRPPLHNGSAPEAPPVDGRAVAFGHADRPGAVR